MAEFDSVSYMMGLKAAGGGGGSSTLSGLNIMTELCEAQVTILAMRIDMDYNTPTPHPFRFYIQAWNDENFTCWASQYLTLESEHESTVPFLEGQVFALHG